MRAFLAACFAVFYFGSLAVAQDEAGSDAVEVDARTETISKTLRCVVCQNQSIYDSNAPLAEDMRRLVRKRVEAGDTDDETREYLRERYGDYVLMSPPFQMNTFLLWIGPFILVALGGGWFLVRLRSGQTVSETPGLSEADRARVDAALKQDEAS